MAVGEAWNHGAALQIDDARVGSGKLPNRGSRPHGGEPPILYRNRFSDRETRIDGDDVAVDQDRVCRRWLRRRRPHDASNGQYEHDRGKQVPHRWSDARRRQGYGGSAVASAEAETSRLSYPFG